MPLVAHTSLPSFKRLQNEGNTVIQQNNALRQDIRELHIGLLNMMPDAALEATERQFFRLIGGSNQIAQFYVHPFTLDALPRGVAAQKHISTYYEQFSEIKKHGLDALIITGANVVGTNLQDQDFWKPLSDVIEWAYQNVTSTLCSCLATHAVMQFRYAQTRTPLGFKRWGVYSHRVVDRTHPLVQGVNTRFDVPHSRFNQISREQFNLKGLKVLVESEEAGPHLVVSEDQFRLVFFQGHPEYDANSLLKEYKREVILFHAGDRESYPPFPENYFNNQTQAILNEYQATVISAKTSKDQLPKFPETIITENIDNTWHDSAEAVTNNWMGLVYRLTDIDRKKPFQDKVDPLNPLER